MGLLFANRATRTNNLDRWINRILKFSIFIYLFIFLLFFSVIKQYVRAHRECKVIMMYNRFTKYNILIYM